ncbi:MULTISPECIES: acyl-CoA dehydrogenase [unclassified Streptomyces]|uniref:acyl-CoA dehydrogenase n=1 Tax=unclassified Streptomyces TaxID=2593676 RepID=UPI0022574116|nr:MULTISPECIES: acyl-CoA dehydrogenase [unclassified Streptomyces]MCX4993183.1 acyl-CoA dehydrogenase [Streptomyces sp. NBC_00568]MCX5009379.1 acyl-CoA dehydrogenase [Streptomyces sp. NBC_00638]
MRAAPSPPATPGGADGGAGSDGAERAARIEELLGDPADPRNPHGHRALLDADEQRRTPQATEALLTDAGLAAEFVPRRLGGRLARPDTLARVLRPLFRRDVALGFGYGITALFGASAVWAAGNRQQRERTARHLLHGDDDDGGGGRVTILHHELTHANAILRDEFTARPAPGGGFVLDGRKDVIINADRARAFVMYARTATAPGPHSHSVLLLDPDQLPPARLRRLPRVATPGMRGNRFAGLEFTHCPVPATALVAGTGDGLPLALRTFMVNRCLIPAALVAGVDSALRLAVRAAVTGRTTGQPARRHQPVLAGVFADLLACDAMAVTALRTLSLLPDSAHLAAAAVKLATQDVLRENLEELATVLGAHGYDRGPLYGGFQKLGRDLPVAGLGHAGSAACQAVLVPRLRALARTSWFRTPEPAPALYLPTAAVPDLDYRRLSLTGGDDVLTATLIGAARRLGPQRTAGPQRAALADLADTFVQEMRTLREQCGHLPEAVHDTLADPRACTLLDRYVLVLAAAACLGVWEGHHHTGTFLAQPAWAVLALSRIGRRLGLPVPEPPHGVVQSVLEEVLLRFARSRSFDVYDTPLAG